MIDLNNLRNGMKLIKEIVKNSDSKKQPWSKEKQRQKVATHKNIRPKSK